MGARPGLYVPIASAHPDVPTDPLLPVPVGDLERPTHDRPRVPQAAQNLLDALSALARKYRLMKDRNELIENARLLREKFTQWRKDELTNFYLSVAGRLAVTEAVVDNLRAALWHGWHEDHCQRFIDAVQDMKYDAEVQEAFDTLGQHCDDAVAWVEERLGLYRVSQTTKDGYPRDYKAALEALKHQEWTLQQDGPAECPNCHARYSKYAGRKGHLDSCTLANLLYGPICTPPREYLQIRGFGETRTWHAVARQGQLPPIGQWNMWILSAGRGWGKTRAAAEWIRERVREGARSIALAGRDLAFVRNVMVEGESGILAVTPEADRPRFDLAKRILTWPNGARAVLISADEGERLRGQESDTYWMEHPEDWPVDSMLYEQITFGCRRSTENLFARGVVTTRKIFTEQERAEVRLRPGTFLNEVAESVPRERGSIRPGELVSFNAADVLRQQMIVETEHALNVLAKEYADERGLLRPTVRIEVDPAVGPDEPAVTTVGVSSTGFEMLINRW